MFLRLLKPKTLKMARYSVLLERGVIVFHLGDGRPAKGKSIDNGRKDNASALTARQLPT